MTEAVDLIVQILYNELRNSGWIGTEHIFISPNNAEGPDMTLESIQNELAKAVQKDEQFSYKNMLDKVKAVCSRPDRICFPDFELGPVHMATYFQVILVISLIKSISILSRFYRKGFKTWCTR